LAVTINVEEDSFECFPLQSKFHVGKDLELIPGHVHKADLDEGHTHLWGHILNREVQRSLCKPSHMILSKGGKVHPFHRQSSLKGEMILVPELGHNVRAKSRTSLMSSTMVQTKGKRSTTVETKESSLDYYDTIIVDWVVMKAPWDWNVNLIATRSISMMSRCHQVILVLTCQMTSFSQ